MSEALRRVYEEEGLLKYYFDNYPETFKQSQLYNQPMYSDRYKEQLFTSENGKYGVLQNYRGDVLGQPGYPGPPNYPANQAQVNFVIPDMVATAVKQPGEAGMGRDELGGPALEERAPLGRDRFGILEVLVEQGARVAGIQAVDVVRAHPCVVPGKPGLSSASRAGGA